MSKDPIKMLRRMSSQTSQRQCAKDIGVSPMYLSDVLAGRRSVGPKILTALGLRREVIYRPK